MLIGVLLLSGIFPIMIGFQVQPVMAATITVPDNYSTIQAAINAAGPGDTVFVKAGIYNGQVIINQSISLIGENRATTIINETAEIGDVVIIRSNGVLFSNFTIRGYKRAEPNPPPSYWVNGSGIFNQGFNNTSIMNVDLTNGGNSRAVVINKAQNTSLIGNLVRGNIYGILLTSCTNITLINNDVRENWGIFFGVFR
jgi:parallel beta-helix repeat protein